jgi:integrase
MEMAIHKRGSGTTFPRGSVWWIQYFVRGLRVRESTGFTKKADAENLLKQRIGEVAAGLRPGPDKATIADLCSLVLEDHRLRHLRSLQHVEWRYEAHIKPLLGSLLSARFGSSQARQYIEQRRQAGALNSTINREFSYRAPRFPLGCAGGDPPLVHRQPMILKLEEDNARQGFIEQEQYDTLLGEMPTNLKALFVCGYHTGAPKNELRRMQWPQVDFDARLIWLSARQTKGKQARTLPIYGDMELWLRRQQETATGNPYVFHGARGSPVGSHLNGWAEACERVGLAGLLFHDMRRSAVRNMKRAGIQDVVAMKITRHKTRSVFDRYNIVDESDFSGSAEKLESYFAQRKTERAAKLKRVK